MGWTSNHTWQTKQDVIKAIKRDYADTIEASAVVGNQFWTVHNNSSSPGFYDKVLVVYVLEKDGGSYAYKNMDESMHPYYYNCPANLVAMVEEPAKSFCTGDTWRKVWLEQQAKKRATSNAKRSLHVGAQVTLSNQWTLTVTSVRPLHGKDANGKTWRIPAKMIQSVDGVSIA